MKKILSFTLVLAMILGSVSFCFAERTITPVTFDAAASTAASFVDVTADMDCYAAVETLKAIGAIEGTSEGRFQPDYALTRAQVVAFIVKALGYPVTEGNAYITKFADVPQTAWYAGYVYWASNLGIVEGRTATKFDPNAKVTADEATAFILRTLGYTDNIAGGYPAGYILVANAFGFYKVISAGAVSVNRGETAQLFNKIIDKPFGAVVTDNSLAAFGGHKAGDFVINEDKDTILEASGVDTVYAVVDQDLIDSDKVNTVELFVYDEDVDDFIPADFYTTVDMSAYLGAEVTLLHKGAKIVGFIPTSEFVTGVTKTGANAATKWFIGGYEVTATLLDGTVSAKTKFNVNVFTNGGLNSNKTTLDTDSTATYAVKVDSTTGKIAKIVSTLDWTATKDYVVNESTFVAPVWNETKVDYDEVAMIGNYVLPTVEKTDKIDYAHVELVGVDKFEDIKVGDVVTVYGYGASEYGASAQYASKVEVSSKTVTGVLTEQTTNLKTVYIDGTKYTSVAGSDVEPTTVEKTYLLNYAGKVVAAKDAAAAEWNYAVILQAYNGNDGKDATLSVAAKEAELPGVRLFTTEGEEVALYFNNEELGEIAEDDEYAPGTLIAYKLDADGYIKAKEENDFKLISDSVDGTVNKKGIVGENVAVFNAASVLFKYTAPVVSTTVVPETQAANWSIVSYQDIVGKTLDAAPAVKTSAELPYVSVAVVTFGTTESANLYVFKTRTKVGTDTYKYTALNLNDGETYTFTRVEPSGDKLTLFSTDWKEFAQFTEYVYTLEVGNTGKITSATTTAALEVIDAFAKLAYTSYNEYNEMSVENDVVYYTSGSGLTATTEILGVLADDVVVYEFSPCVDKTNDSSKVSAAITAKTVEDLNGLKASYAYKDITVLAYEPDGEIDMVIIYKGDAKIDFE